MSIPLKLRALFFPVAITIFPAVGFGSLSYTLVRLDDQEAYGQIRAAGLNDAGGVLVDAQSADTPGDKFTSGAYIWQNGREVNPFPGTLTAMNHQGWVGGTLDSGVPAIEKPGGKVQVLPITPIDQLNGSFGVWDMNDADQAVGWGANSANYDTVAYFWDHGKLHDLGGFGSNFAQAVQINADGQILITTPNEAFLWQNGKSAAIQAPSGDTLAANDLNGHGEVVGAVYQGEAILYGFAWKNGAMQELPPLPGDEYSWASGVNDRGEIVGTSWSDGEPQTPVMWEDGKVISLLPDITGTKGWTFLQPTEINNEGLIAGEGYLHFSGPFDTQQRAFLLQPDGSAMAIPLPSEVWLGISGLPLLGWKLRRSAKPQSA
jgi:hypothetical protein